MARDVLLAIEIHKEPKVVFDTVTSAEGLASFWTSDVESVGGSGGRLTFGFPSAPTRLPVTVTHADAPSAVGWSFGGDWPFWDGTTGGWSFEPSEHGTKVTFRHDGFADEMPEFDAGSIALTWALVVNRLKQVVESDGASKPALG